MALMGSHSAATRLAPGRIWGINSSSLPTGRLGGRPGHVAAGTREVADQPRSDRVGGADHHNRYRRGSLLRGDRGRRGDRNDDVRPILHDLRRKSRQTCEIAFCGAAIDHDGLAVDVAKIAHALPERRLPEIGTGREQADERHLRLLRSRYERRCEQATGNAANECSPTHHWITSVTIGNPDILRPQVPN